MNLMTNLFESFDTMTSLTTNYNMLSMHLEITFLPLLYWMIPGRYQYLWNMFLSNLYENFMLMSTKKYQSNIFLFLSILSYIMMSNLISMVPYVFPMTSHMSLNFSMSMSLWLSFMIYYLYKNTKKFLIHLIPMNTPLMLINFMVLIELISNIIRPLTLAIRLTANLIAGHLLMILLGTFMMNFVSFMLLMILIQNMLMMLELFMSFIQAYVFSTLSILYFSESKK